MHELSLSFLSCERGSSHWCGRAVNIRVFAGPYLSIAGNTRVTGNCHRTMTSPANHSPPIRELRALPEAPTPKIIIETVLPKGQGKKTSTTKT